MATTHIPSKTQAEFEIRFIWWALGIAIFGGFALGAHVVSVIGFDFPLGKGFSSYIQIHGHVQFVGWAGLLILGISLHFLPRLAGLPIKNPQRPATILRLIVSGLIIRFVGHSFLPYLTKSALLTPVSILVTLSGLLEWLGIVFYIITVYQTTHGAQGVDKQPALHSIKPFMMIMLMGWFLYATFNIALLVNMTAGKNVILNPSWNEFAVQLFFHFVLLPVTFAFSIRMFPLFLRLPAIDWPVRRFAFSYILAITLQLLPNLPPIAAVISNVPFYVSGVGLIAKGSAILWFVWKLDLFTRRRPPWTIHRVLEPGPERKPTRAGLPDYGEFGRFERLIYSAYAWLLLGAVLDILSGLAILLDWTVPISSDAIRHTYLLGFVTQLILGMAVRMIPGFLRKKRVAVPELVEVTFWLANVAAVSRVVPLILPLALYELLPGIEIITQSFLGFSGIFGLAAVVCLTINLKKTANN
ncbi:MAG: hypothetical protein ACE5IR_14045 [bacterium]